MRNKILLVEDDLGLATPLKDFFQDNGLEVFLATTGEEGLTYYQQYRPDLMVIDVILPGKNGFELISEIRNIDLQTPIVMMTGTETTPESQIKGYQLGAINYMSKPLLPQALLALIQHTLSLPKSNKQFYIDQHCIRIQSQIVQIDTKKCKLREKDAILLELLLERKNQIVQRTMLLNQIWLDDHPDNNNLLDGAILRIRRLFHRHDTAIRINTVYGQGYILEEINENQ